MEKLQYRNFKLSMNLSSIIESILFISGEPVTINRLSKIAGASEEEIGKALDELAVNLDRRGIVLVRKDHWVVLATNPLAQPFVDKIAKEVFDRELTRAALETLSIIIYKGPVTRAEIDFIRGVNSGFTVRNLMLRGLVERTVNPKDGRAYLYQPSIQMLAFLGVKKIEEIPQYLEFRSKIDEYLQNPAPNIDSTMGVGLP